MLTFTDAVWACTISLSVAWLLPKVNRFVRVYYLFGKLPGGLHYSVADTEQVLAAVLPPLPAYGVGDPRANASPYRKAGTSIIASTPILNPKPMLWVADPSALKTIFNDRITFQKQKEQYKLISFYGPNIMSLEGADWKRHHDVALKGLKPSNNLLVWCEAARCAREWFSVLERSEPGRTGVLVDAAEIMTRIAFLVFTSVAFGRKVSFEEDADEQPTPDYKFTFRAALSKTIDLLLVKALAPRWLSYVPVLGRVVREALLAYDELHRHLLEMAAEVRNSPSDGEDEQSKSKHLFRLLVLANEDETAKTRLSDDELLSTIYTILIAGHDTTANTLAFALAFLALYPDCQRKLHEELDQVWPSGLPSDLAAAYRHDIPKLTYTEAIFRETLRLRPAEMVLHRVATTATTLRGMKRSTGLGKGTLDESYEVPVPKGCTVWIDVWATLMMEDYWGPDSKDFRPERFIDTDSYTWPRDAYIPFGAGGHVCIGQRFSFVEAVCILGHVARLFDILVPPALAHLPFEQQKEQLLRWTKGVATTAVNAKVVLRQRANM